MAGEEEEHDARVAEMIKNFNDSDDGEDSWEAGHFQDVDDLDEQFCGSIEQAGKGGFIAALTPENNSTVHHQKKITHPATFR